MRKWCREFRVSHSTFHDEERRGRASVQTNDLAECVNAKDRENCQFTINDLSIEFPEVSKITLFKIVADTLVYR